jgi:hypothetical protein
VEPTSIYAVLQKIYGNDANKRYSPAVCLGCTVETVTGDPNDADVDAPVHVPDECLLKKGRESRRSRGSILHVLQTSATCIRRSA